MPNEYALNSNLTNIILRGSNTQGDTQYLGGISVQNMINTPAELLDTINKYRGNLQYTSAILSGSAGAPGTETRKIVYDTITSPSLFNPFYSVKTAGITSNVPLLDTTKNADNISAIKHTGETFNSSIKLNGNIDDCSIANLVYLSKFKDSVLGQAKYKYTDFMYCRDVGKISNNHMITLRRFATAVGDNITRYTAIKDEASNIEVAGDVGRLITWFGNEDNKLEDIIKFNYKASWRELEAERQERKSEETNKERGMLGGLVNLFNPEYNKAKGEGRVPSAFNLILGDDASDAIYTSAPYEGNPVVNGAKYDKNRIYEPKDTIRSTHKYEGKLEFTHNFTLKFAYKLRGYDNINAKSAFLDLLGNILAVTYRTGTFWPGEQRIIGAPQNKAGWNKATSIASKGLDASGSFISAILNGESFGTAADSFTSQIGQLMGSIGFNCDSLGDALNSLKSTTEDLFKNKKLGEAIKGMFTDQMGRPAVYAFDSLLTDDVVGTWHVTIGNPLNPILTIGNLIIDDCEIQQGGPLGLDDFPTELYVTIKLKHGKPRDSVDIQRMYTQGKTAIYTKISNENNINIELLNSNSSGNSNLGYGDVNDAETTKSGKTNEYLAESSESTTINVTDIYNGQMNDFIGWFGDSESTRLKIIRDELK